jgi:hypothetical protein
MGGEDSCLNHEDNAPAELSTAEKKYGMNVEAFFRNVRDCNNRFEGKPFGIDHLGKMTECFYPLYYLQTTNTDELWRVNKGVADKLQISYPDSRFDLLWHCWW